MSGLRSRYCALNNISNEFCFIVDYNLIADCNVKDLLVESMKTTLELDKWKEKIDFNVESVKIGK